jgi:hypothetical protein
MNNYLKRLNALWRPEVYQGWGREQRYFEGWYFKLISADEQEAIAVIPGLSMGIDGEKQAFVQVMHGKTCTADFHRFPGEAFKAQFRKFEVEIGPNSFSAEKIQLDLPGLKGEISFKHITPWPKMLGAPGIMGWYSFVPMMECNHGVVSLHHSLAGQLLLEGQDGTKLLDFDQGKGYIEKDWGRSFPRAYVWMQSNHFDGMDEASLMASVAHIPWLGSYFVGFICGFWLQGKLYRFATYTGARKYLKINDNMLELVFKSRRLELRILAAQAPGASLVSPISGEMTGKIQESLMASVQVQLLEDNKVVYEGSGRNAGLEVAGNLDVIVD